MTGELSTNFHGVGIGPLSKILAVKYVDKMRGEGVKKCLFLSTLRV